MIEIKVIEGRAALRLKAWTAGAAASAAHAEWALPPQMPTILSETARVLRIGPGDWLILSRQPATSALQGQLEPDLSKQDFALVDLTAGMATLDIRGAAAGELLSKGCGVDLHARGFPFGHCVRTRFAQIPLIIERLDNPQRFELHVARSYLHYLRDWILDAAELDGQAYFAAPQ